MTSRALVFALIVVSVFGLRAGGADWPQWRGPGRDGLWPESGLVRKFSGERLPVRWRAKIANGYSGPTVADGRVYVTDRLASPTELERVHCFDAMSGKSVWSHSYECSYNKVDKRNGPRAAVTIGAGRAYSLGTMGHLFCFDAVEGEVLWKKDLRTQYKIKMPLWGIAASPLIEGDLLIVHIGGRPDSCLAAFDKVTGREKWRALKDSVSYSAPIVIDQAGKRVLLCWTGERIVGLDPQTGKLHWEYPFPPIQMVHNIGTPVFENNYLFTSEFFSGSLLLKVHPDKLAVENLWRRQGDNERVTDSLHCCISTPFMRGDYIYGLDSYGELRCLDLHTGDRIWETQAVVPKARWATAHMVRQADKVWIFNERGELIISKLSPKGYTEISRAKLIDPTEGQLGQRGGVCWSHPAFAYKHIYARNDRELVCADLSATD